MPVGITITEIGVSTLLPTLEGIDRVYMVITSTNTADANNPVQVRDLAAFSSRFPGAQVIVTASVRHFFRNYPQGNLYIVTANDPAIVGDPTAVGHFSYALDQLRMRINLDLGVLIIPEMANVTAQADRTTLYSAAESLCQRRRWLHFVNLASGTDTKAKAIAERALYASPFGHSAAFYSFIIDPETQRVPIAVTAAAIELKRSKEESPYSPPAGAKYPIQGVASVANYVFDESDYEDLKAQNINVVQDIPKIGLCLWGARSLAIDPKFGQINTRAAISIISKQLDEALTPILFEESDPQGFTRREVIRVSTSILERGYLQGGLSGETSDEAYKIVQTELASDVPNLRKFQIKIYARFVDTLEQIEVQLINVDQIPA